MQNAVNLRARRSGSVWLWLLPAMMILMALPVASVRAQEADELVDEEFMADTSAPRFKLMASGGFVDQADADLDNGGSVQAFRYDLGVVVPRTKVVDNLGWDNTFFFGASTYDFDGQGFGAGNPWNTILSLRYVTKLTYSIDQQWGVTAGGIFIISPETNADFGDSFTGGGLLAAEYRHSDTLFVSLGVAVITQIEDDPAITPSVVVNWVPATDWTVRVGSVPASGGAAAAAEVAYDLGVPLELGLGVLYQQRRFRLDNSGPVPNGVGEDNNLPVRLRLGWDISQNFSLNILAGVALAGQVRLENSSGHLVVKDDYDPAAYVGIRFFAAL